MRANVLSRERKTANVAETVAIRENGWYDKGPVRLFHDLGLAGQECICDRD